MVLDASYLYFRAFFGVPTSVQTPQGRPINAVRGTLDLIARLITEYQPTHLACCWDEDWRPEWRVELVPSYKTHRVAQVVADDTDIEEVPDELSPQVPLLRACLDALGLPVVGAEGYEADDVIGSFCAQAEMPVIAVSGDRDLFQVVDDDRDVRLLYIAQGMAKKVLADGAHVQAKYGVAPQHYADYATLRGDPSDGLPGVAGVGEKSAAQLITKYGDLEAILAAASDPGSGMAPGLRSKLGAAIDYIAPALQVVRVVTDLSLPALDELALPGAPRDADAFAALTHELGLGGSAERIVAALARPTA